MLQPIAIRSTQKRKVGDRQDPPTSRLTDYCASSNPITTAKPSPIDWWQTIQSDFQIIFERDPAARNWLEVLLCYPGLHALALHRVANWLWQLHLPLIPRLLSHLGRFFTGIEIHPGAAIGKGVFIDHGMGVVIGETAIVGNYCLIYQDVTLGGTGKETGKRHPTIGNNVVIGAGARVLGNIHIGDRVRIGAGSIVLQNVPENCTVVGIPGRIISPKQHIESDKLPDVEGKLIGQLLTRIEQLEKRVKSLQHSHSKALVSQVSKMKSF